MRRSLFISLLDFRVMVMMMMFILMVSMMMLMPMFSMQMCGEQIIRWKANQAEINGRD